MLIKDDSCIAEQTVMRYQNNNIASLLASDWYGIMLLSPKGKEIIDTCFDVSNVGNNAAVEFVNSCISYEFLQNGTDKTFTHCNSYFYVYPIRKTDKGYMVFFLFYRKSSPFPEHDIIWYRTYAKAAYQRLLLENELVQVQNYNNAILDNSDCAIAVIDKEYKVISANSAGKEYFGAGKLNTGRFANSSAMLQAIDDVLVGGKKNCRLSLLHYAGGSMPRKRQLDVSISPLATSKGIVSAVIVIATNITSINTITRIEDRKHYYKETVNIFRSFLNDIRTPIMNIRGCLDLLQNNFEPDSEQAKLMSFIFEECAHAEKACSDFDAFQAVTECGSAESADLCTLLKNCITIIQRKSGLRQVDVRTHSVNETINLKGNIGELYMAFLTLMEGLLEFINDKGTIEISSTLVGQHEMISLEFMCKFDSENASLEDAVDALVSDMIEKNKGTLNVSKLAENCILCTVCIPIC